MFEVNFIYNDTDINIEFPCDESYLYGKLQEIHVPDEEKVSPKLFIREINDFEELKCLEENFVDLDELNYFAKRLDGMDGKTFIKFKAVMSLGGLRSMPDLINLTFNEHYYTLIQDMSSPEKIGRQHYLTRNSETTEQEMADMDFAKIGKNLIKSGQAKLTPYGLIVINDNLEYERPYNGRTFPVFYYDDRRVGVMFEYKGEKEYIYLPDLPIAIEKAIKRLGAESIDDCTLQFDKINYPNEEIDSILTKVLEKDGINALNALTNNLKFYCTEEHLNNFPDVVEYVGAEDFDTIMKISETPDSFIILRDVWDDKELGKRWMADYTDYYPHDDVMNFFDFEAYGEHIREETDGKFMDSGDYICVEEGMTIKKVLEKANNERSDMAMGGI